MSNLSFVAPSSCTPECSAASGGHNKCGKATHTLQRTSRKTINQDGNHVVARGADANLDEAAARIVLGPTPLVGGSSDFSEEPGPLPELGARTWPVAANCHTLKASACDEGVARTPSQPSGAALPHGPIHLLGQRNKKHSGKSNSEHNRVSGTSFCIWHIAPNWANHGRLRVKERDRDR